MEDSSSRILLPSSHKTSKKLHHLLGASNPQAEDQPMYVISPFEPYINPIKPNGYGEAPVETRKMLEGNIDKESGSHLKTIRVHMQRTDKQQEQLLAQLLRSGITCVFTLFSIVFLLLFALWGPELSEPTSVFGIFLLAVCAAMFLISLFTFITPVVDVVGLQRINVWRKEIEAKRLAEQQNALIRIIHEAMGADNPKKVLAENILRNR